MIVFQQHPCRWHVNGTHEVCGGAGAREGHIDLRMELFFGRSVSIAIILRKERNRVAVHGRC